MRRLLRGRRLDGWLALFGLVLQLALNAAHSASYFDHLIGQRGAGHAVPVAAQPGRRSDVPAPDDPAAPDDDHCAIDLFLAATGHIVLAEPALVPLRLEFEIARLAAAASPIILAVRRHNLPPARAPPAFDIS